MWASVQAAPQTSNCARNMAEIGKALAMYENFSRGHCPATLGDTLPYVLKYIKRQDPMTGQNVALTPAEAARIYLCSQEQDVEIPEEVTPEWINEHTSFVYLADAGNTEAVDPLAALLYERLDAGHGDVVNMLFADLHVQAHDKDEAQMIIDKSIRWIEEDRARTAAKAAGNGSATAGPAQEPSRPSRVAVDPNAARVDSLRRLMQMLVEDTRNHGGATAERPAPRRQVRHAESRPEGRAGAVTTGGGAAATESASDEGREGAGPAYEAVARGKRVVRISRR